MPKHTDTIRQRLSTDIANAAQRMQITKIGQPTLSRTLKAMGGNMVRIGVQKSVRAGMWRRLPHNCKDWRYKW